MSRQLRPMVLTVLLMSWLAATGVGFGFLSAYHARPGSPGAPPSRWPEGGPIGLDATRPTLLIFLHPRCPCSTASVAELASIAALSREGVSAYAILYRPEGPGEGWNRAIASAFEEAAVPGLRRWVDPGGRLGRRFGVETSGHVLLFDPGGMLLFDGGITGSRGHRGGTPASMPWSPGSRARGPGRPGARSSAARSSTPDRARPWRHPDESRRDPRGAGRRADRLPRGPALPR